MLSIYIDPNRTVVVVFLVSLLMTMGFVIWRVKSKAPRGKRNF
jgi:hypothetical protein